MNQKDNIKLWKRAQEGHKSEEMSKQQKSKMMR